MHLLFLKYTSEGSDIELEIGDVGIPTGMSAELLKSLVNFFTFNNFLSKYCNLEQKILPSQYLAELKFMRYMCPFYIFKVHLLRVRYLAACVCEHSVCMLSAKGRAGPRRAGRAGPSKAGRAGPSRAGRAGPSRAVEPTAQGSPPLPSSPPLYGHRAFNIRERTPEHGQNAIPYVKKQREILYGFGSITCKTTIPNPRV